MSDDQTAEQKAANEQLDEAIRRVSLAYGYDGVVTTWVVSASYVTASASGEGSGVGLFFPGGGDPLGGCYRVPPAGDPEAGERLPGRVMV